MVALTFLWKCDVRTILTISNWKTPQVIIIYGIQDVIGQGVDPRLAGIVRVRWLVMGWAKKYFIEMWDCERETHSNLISTASVIYCRNKVIVCCYMHKHSFSEFFLICRNDLHLYKIWAEWAKGHHLHLHTMTSIVSTTIQHPSIFGQPFYIYCSQ